ncbi:MAG: DUF202 domain-containing protein [Deinococcota bacterium]|jgi:putative membrane protein|nr:DUF202 domain-containing protein [Deinococcota bacterium]
MADEDDPRVQLAEDRTDWAQERTLLAKERTFSGWLRTGLAMVAAGLGVTRLLPEVEPEWLVLSLGTALVLMGGVAVAMGFWSYRKTLKRLEEEGIRGVPAWIIGAFTLVFLLGAGAGLVLILL